MTYYCGTIYLKDNGKRTNEQPAVPNELEELIQKYNGKIDYVKWPMNFDVYPEQDPRVSVGFDLGKSGPETAKGFCAEVQQLGSVDDLVLGIYTPPILRRVKDFFKKK